MRNQTVLRAADVVGDDIVLDGAPDILNLGFMSIGTGVVVKSAPVVSHLITAPGAVLSIENDVCIGHGASISASSKITIERGARIGAFAIIIDTDFHEVGHHDSSGAAAPIVIGEGAILGSRVTVLRGAVIGAGASVGAGSVVSGGVRPGAQVSGVPARENQAPDVPLPSVGTALSAVLAIVRETFALDRLPDPEQSLESIEGWDSLGTLNLLLSLEERFGLSFSGEELFRVSTLRELAQQIENARGHVRSR
jgi:acetyltransferase-like isoleucine patch superfamily enzyme/acyl carrier protein